MTPVLSLFAALIIGGISLMRPGVSPNAPRAECGVAGQAAGATPAGASNGCALVAQTAAAPGRSTDRGSMGARVGMTLAPLTFYSSEIPFVDRMRNSQGWVVTYSGQPQKTVQQDGIPLDAGGTPTLMPANAYSLNVAIPFDDLGTGTTRRYVLLYDGDLVFGGGPGIKIVDRRPGRITFTQADFGPQQTIFSERFNKVHNIHVVREDQLALLQAGKLFNPAFLDRVKLFSPIRFMDWQATNGNKVVHWSDRQPVSNQVWANNGGTIGEAGAPIETMVQLANEAHVEPWFCIPAHADDDYIRQFATYVRDHLDPTLRPRFEYSNEVWNGAFEQAHYADEQGKALLHATDAANEVFYGYRAAQMATIIRSIMGERARMVISVFTNNEGTAPFIFAGIAKVGDAAKLFNEYAVTTYWGGGLSGGTDKDRATVLGWAKGGQAGVDAAFDAITRRTALENNFDSLPGLAGVYASHAARARKYGLDLVAYEGGFGVTGYSYSGPDQAVVVDFLTRMQASPHMGIAIKRMVDDFAAAGGKSLVYFNDVGTASVHGTWGTTKTIYDKSPTLDVLTAVNTAGR